MIEATPLASSALFTDPYHDVMARSLIQRPRKKTGFYTDPESAIQGVFDPDLGFSYVNRNQQDMKKWAQWLYNARIPLIAGELHSHYNLLQAMGSILPPENEVQVFCRYEFQDFCIYKQEPKASYPDSYRIKQATVKDTDKLFTFYERSETMQAKSKESLRYTIENNRLLYLQRTGKIVSSVLTHCESNEAALIGGVYTPAKYRGKGYAKACMEALMIALKKDKKTPCLFYEKNNTSAKKLYQKLGFQQYGEWVVIEMTYEDPSNVSTD